MAIKRKQFTKLLMGSLNRKLAMIDTNNTFYEAIIGLEYCIKLMNHRKKIDTQKWQVYHK